MAKTFTATQIATELNLNPKKVRAILRKAGFQRNGTRWTFDVSERAKVRQTIRDAIKPKRAPRRNSNTVEVPMELAMH